MGRDQKVNMVGHYDEGMKSGLISDAILKKMQRHSCSHFRPRKQVSEIKTSGRYKAGLARLLCVSPTVIALIHSIPGKVGSNSTHVESSQSPDPWIPGAARMPKRVSDFPVAANDQKSYFAHPLG